MDTPREHFASRLGFIFMTAGCAIGLGNVWRFPYVAGQNGGGLFVLLYLACLLLFGIPVLMMELAVGRAGQSTFPGSFRKLKQSSFPWQKPAYLLFSGNLILLMFYTVITGWLLYYAAGFAIRNPGIYEKDFFGGLTGSWQKQTVYMLASLLITVLICAGGVRKTIEKSIKYMMGGLFILLGVLVIYSLTRKGAGAGVKFLLMPKFEAVREVGLGNMLHAAMTQAFFTLSLGIGSIAICGSYIGKERSLMQEGLWIILLDTIVAVSAGLIIFPTCMANGINPGAGPELIFVTLPKVFSSITGGFILGVVFFIFLAIAALSTLVAVFENLVAFGMDEFHWDRKKSCLIFGIALAVLCLPCVFGFNLWANFHPLGGKSNILDLEDFIVSANLLPLGALYLTIFCASRYGWNMDNFFTEVNTGTGKKFPLWMKNYIRFGIPVILIALWAIGIVKIFV